MTIPTRDDAYALLREFNESESLIKHALAVEGVMRYMARKRGEDPDVWGIVGLIHDLDYERYPDDHPHKAREILEQRDWPQEWVRAMMSHGWTLVTDVEPESEMEKVLFAVDELTGLVTAAALVRPSRSVMDLSVKSLKKKWKDKSFAAGANRDVIQRGADMLGIDLTDLFADVIEGMRDVADALGLGLSTDPAEG